MPTIIINITNPGTTISIIRAIQVEILPRRIVIVGASTIDRGLGFFSTMEQALPFTSTIEGNLLLQSAIKRDITLKSKIQRTLNLKSKLEN